MSRPRRILVQRLTVLIAAALAGGALLAPAGQAATFTVDNTTDAAGSCPTPTTCSLRQAVTDANITAGSDAIGFALPAGSVISLTAGELVLAPTDTSDFVSITGPGAAALTVRRDPAAAAGRVFRVSLGSGTTLSGFTISGGLVGAGNGPAITANRPLELDRMAITGNQADAGGNGGAGALVLGDRTTIRATTISGNTVVNAGPGQSGGAIVNLAPLLVVSSTIADNHVTGPGPNDGGAILNFGPATLVNSTISQNSAEGGSGGIFAAPFELANSILAGNTASPSADCAATLESRGYNVVGSPAGCTIVATTGDQVGTVVTALNPLLGPLAANGGPTPTMALLAGSPARDAGNPATPSDVLPLPPALTPCATSDQRGVSRPAGPRCDIGAFEVVPPPPPAATPPPVPPPVAPPVPPPVPPPPVFVAPPVDHFKCYDAVQRGLRVRSVRLRDQFSTRARVARVRRTTHMCNPVRKNDSRITQPAAHLVCYATKDVARFGPRNVVVSNQFGTSRLRVLRPVSLCVPSLKRKGTRAPGTSPDPQQRLDHFRCYAVAPKLTPRPVALVDQFVRTRSTVVSVVRLCNPVSKNGGAVRRPTAHLVCYSIRDVAAERTRAVTVRNQFGVARLRASKARHLCLPSLKRLLPTTAQTRSSARRSWPALR